MGVVRDKIVQQAIRKIIEPRFEKLFLSNSYAYRPGKGALKTIKYIVKQCGNKDYQYALRLDVDNFFDEIDYTILQQRLTAIGIENELIRLIMLSVKMGRVKPSGVWNEPTKGIPQGAVLSPLLANLYLHSFDQFAVSKGLPYARYGDDSFILCKTQDQANEIKDKTQKYLASKLKLSLNTSACSKISDGFDFLGVTIKGQKVFITERKKEELEGRVLGLFFGEEGLVPKSKKIWDGLRNYYAKLLPQEDLEFFDAALIKRIIFAIEDSEAQVAIRYWDYIRELIQDDDVCFEKREHQGATDIVNSMLNYGYAILYVRVWQALLAAKLNPFDSIIHARQEGKPTLVYDLVEVFRSQVVDRIVISLIQKGQDLQVRNGLLTDKTRQLLVKYVEERLVRNEKYQGEEMKMEQIIQRQAKLLAKVFDGSAKYKPYVAKW